jgi:hypothetical protein
MPPALSLDEKRAIAHSMVGHAVREGLLKRGPCVVCGSTKNVQFHHPTYDRPLFVVLLCAADHQRVHNGTIPDPGAPFGAEFAACRWARSSDEFDRAVRQAAVSGKRPNGMPMATFRAALEERGLAIEYDESRQERGEMLARDLARWRSYSERTPKPAQSA